MFIVLGVFLVSVLRLFHLLLQRLVLPRLRPRRRRLPPILSLPLLLPPPLLLLLLLLLLLVLLSVENGSPSPSMQVSGNSPATFRQTTRATHLPEKKYCDNSVFCRSVTIFFRNGELLCQLCVLSISHNSFFPATHPATHRFFPATQLGLLCVVVWLECRG